MAFRAGVPKTTDQDKPFQPLAKRNANIYVCGFNRRAGGGTETTNAPFKIGVLSHRTPRSSQWETQRPAEQRDGGPRLRVGVGAGQSHAPRADPKKSAGNRVASGDGPSQGQGKQYQTKGSVR